MDKPFKAQVQTIPGLILFILKMSAASGIAWELAKWAGSKHPFLAPLSVILCVQTTLLQSIRYSTYRLLGTVLGSGVTIWAADRLSLNAWTLALLLVFVGAIALLLARKESVIRETVLSVLLVFALQQQSGQYGFDRIRDTMIGLAVGLAVHMLVFPPNLVKQTEHAVLSLMDVLAGRFRQTAEWVQGGCRGQQEASLHAAGQTFQKELFQVQKKVEKAAKSLKFNLWAQSKRPSITDKQKRMVLIKRGAAYLDTAVATFSEWSSAGALTEDEQNRWAAQLRAFGDYWENQSVKKTGQPAIPFPDTKSTYEVPDGAVRYRTMLYTETSQLLEEIERSF